MEAFLAVGELQATARHIELIDQKLEKLTRARADSWSQILTAAARLVAVRQMDEGLIVDLYDSMKSSYGVGFTRVWDQHMPIKANRVPWFRSELPNGPAGSWVGEIPIGDGPCPPCGVAVVYVLFDGENDPVYVGSSDYLRARLRSHKREKPEARRWAAYRCRDREHAYQVEDRLLKEHKPRMNKKASR